jgi:hypothetical protein
MVMKRILGRPIVLFSAGGLGLPAFTERHGLDLWEISQTKNFIFPAIG